MRDSFSSWHKFFGQCGIFQTFALWQSYNQLEGSMPTPPAQCSVLTLSLQASAKRWSLYRKINLNVINEIKLEHLAVKLLLTREYVYMHMHIHPYAYTPAVRTTQHLKHILKRNLTRNPFNTIVSLFLCFVARPSCLPYTLILSTPFVTRDCIWLTTPVHDGSTGVHCVAVARAGRRLLCSYE